MPNNNDINLPIPGSLVLVDVDGHAHGTHMGNSDIVLAPKPSNDVNDPLRWTRRRKLLHMLMLFIYCISAGNASASLYSVLVPIQEQTGISLATLNEGTGVLFLFLGWGGVIMQPLALTFGKRPMYVLSSLAHIGVVIWHNYISSAGEWQANKVIQGILVSPIEMLVEASIADVFYAHERGFWIGMYGMALFVASYSPSIWAGFVNDALGYKWVFWVSAIQLAVATVIMFLFLEETNYNRGTTELSDDHGTGEVADTDDAGEKKEAGTVTVAETTELEGTPHGFLRRLAMFNKRYTTLSTLGVMIYRPFLLMRFPVIVWSGILYGSALIWFNVLNATAGLIFMGSYGFSAAMVGLTYLAPTIGSILSPPWSGWFSDRVALRFARRRGGVREPEDRLWVLLLNAVLAPTGLVLWGVGAAKHVHWFGLCVGAVLLSFTSASGGATAINYALDSYKDLGGESLITIMIIRNTMGFAMSYGITPWVTKMGYQNTFVTAAIMGLVFYLSFLPVIKWGRRWRASSSGVYWRYVESSVMKH